MVKQQKLKLEDLKVQSFVTALSDQEQSRLMGGLTRICSNQDPDCSDTTTVLCESRINCGSFCPCFPGDTGPGRECFTWDICGPV